MDGRHFVERGPTEFYVSVRQRFEPVQSIAVTLMLYIVGIALLAQPERWSRTPAYGNLLILATARTWGIIHLAIGILLFLAVFIARSSRAFSIVAHTLTIMLLATWEIAFIVRYLTDSATTVANVVSWASFLFLAVRSALLFEHPVIIEHPQSIE